MDAKEQRSLEELLELYLARFGQQFPIMLCRTMEDEKNHHWLHRSWPSLGTAAI